VIQRKRKGRWKRVGRVKAGKNRIFAGRVRAGGKPVLRAKSKKQTSLRWRTR
jgi:hypothetical protein